MAQYLFLLALLLLGELSVGALAALGPQFLGLAVEQPRLADALQRGYGVPGREQFTAAFDLAHVSVSTAHRLPWDDRGLSQSVSVANLDPPLCS